MRIKSYSFILILFYGLVSFAVSNPESAYKTSAAIAAHELKTIKTQARTIQIYRLSSEAISNFNQILSSKLSAPLTTNIDDWGTGKTSWRRPIETRVNYVTTKNGAACKVDLYVFNKYADSEDCFPFIGCWSASVPYSENDRYAYLNHEGRIAVVQAECIDIKKSPQPFWLGEGRSKAEPIVENLPVESMHTYVSENHGE